MPSILVADIGGTSMKLGAVVHGAPADHVRRVPSQGLRTGDPVSALAGILTDFASETGHVFDCVVMTVPGFIDRDFNHVIHAANLPELNDLPLAREVGERLGLPVYLERDAVLLLQGERAAGSAQGCRDVLGIFFGTGVGAAYVHDGAVFRGAGWALEIGHMPIHGTGQHLEGLTPDALEVAASGRRLGHLAELHGVPVERVFEQDGPPALRDALDVFVRDQAMGTASCMLTLCPPVVVLGGGVLDMPGYPRAALLAAIKARASLPPGRPLDLRFASRGWKAVLDAAPGLVAARRAGAPLSSRQPVSA